MGPDEIGPHVPSCTLGPHARNENKERDAKRTMGFDLVFR